MGHSKSKSGSDEFSKMPKGQQVLLKQIREFKNEDYSPQSQWMLSNGITLHIANGDLCKFHGDAIINSANEKMLGGSGVDGAIHRAAGDELREYIRDNIDTLPNEPYKRCLTGDAIITPGFLLNTPFVIHTAGPKYQVDDNPDILLQSCYKSCLELADNNNLKTIGFSAVSCGGFRYPKEDAMKIAFSVCDEYKCLNGLLEHIWFVVNAKGMYQQCADIAMDFFGTDQDDDKQSDNEQKED